MNLYVLPAAFSAAASKLVTVSRRSMSDEPDADQVLVLSVCVYVCVCLSVRLSVCPSVCLSVCVSVQPIAVLTMHQADPWS